MSCFCPTRVLGLFSHAFGSATESVNTLSLISDEAIVYEGKTMKVIVPDCPLAVGSLKILPLSGIGKFSEWQDFNKLEAYELIQLVVQIWQKKGITDYLIYGKESVPFKSTFNWEIVPYPKNGWRFWKQFKVLWNITFGGSCLPKVERNRIVKDFQKDKDSFSESLTKQIESIKKTVRENDAFCNQKVINKQLVFEGKEMYVLYNYAPIVLGKEKLHFLIVPKQHHSKFSDLTETEYLETMQLSQKLISFYKNRGYHTAYLFDKTGAEAGQTVPHWHEHVVFTAKKTQEFLGKLTVLKNMLIGSSPLSQKELQTLVESFRNELNEVLKN
jgi:diadenosine tetraphosphate (Ap4A) HIT family hydrolase